MPIQPNVGRDGRWSEQATFRYNKLDEDGTGDYFETSQAKTATPTLLLDTDKDPTNLLEGIITRIHYRLNPTNAVTFTLRIWRAAVAADYASNLTLLWESPAAQADDVDYDETELRIPFKLAKAGELYYSIEWSAASGDTLGFIEVSGETVK